MTTKPFHRHYKVKRINNRRG